MATSEATAGRIKRATAAAREMVADANLAVRNNNRDRLLTAFERGANRIELLNELNARKKRFGAVRELERRVMRGETVAKKAAEETIAALGLPEGWDGNETEPAAAVAGGAEEPTTDDGGDEGGDDGSGTGDGSEESGDAAGDGDETVAD